MKARRNGRVQVPGRSRPGGGGLQHWGRESTYLLYLLGGYQCETTAVGTGVYPYKQPGRPGRCRASSVL